MKLMHEQLNITGNNTIKVKWDDFPHFTFPWHHHNEFEIVYILKSYGKRFVGDNVADFAAGDLVLLGSNLPHFWKNAPEFYENNPRLKVNAVVVQFSPELFGSNMLLLPEFAAIRNLLSLSDRGIKFTGKKKDLISKRIYKLQKINGIERFIELLNVLNLMTKNEEIELLASAHYERNTTGYSDKRINEILTFLNFNYTQKINLDTIANISCMNVTAMCRYFKKNTGKTIVQHLNELRIGYACKLMNEKQLPVSYIALECGFNNMSNFNKIFKQITRATPTEYLNLLKKV